jgi:hypothetical protein
MIKMMVRMRIRMRMRMSEFERVVVSLSLNTIMESH